MKCRFSRGLRPLRLLVSSGLAPLTVVGSHGLRDGEAANGPGNGRGGCWLLVVGWFDPEGVTRY